MADRLTTGSGGGPPLDYPARMRSRPLVTLAALPVAALLMAGCSSSDSGDAASSSAAPSAAAPSVPAPIGSGAKAPVTIDMMEAAHDVKVGDTIVFNVRNVVGTTVDSDNPEVLAVTQAGESEGVVYNPGGTALKPGKVTVTITDEKNDPHYIHIEVTE